MARVPIIHIGETLIATVQEDLRDQDALDEPKLALYEQSGQASQDWIIYFSFLSVMYIIKLMH